MNAFCTNYRSVNMTATPIIKILYRSYIHTIQLVIIYVTNITKLLHISHHLSDTFTIKALRTRKILGSESNSNFGNGASNSRGLRIANDVMSRSTLRTCFTVVSCQFERWRLWPTDQAMKARLDVGGRSINFCTKVRMKILIPMSVNFEFFESVTMKAEPLCSGWWSFLGSV